MEKGIQVCVKFGKILKRNSFSQTDLLCFENKDAETQCGVEKSSYGRSNKLGKWTYDRRRRGFMSEGRNHKLVHDERGIDST